MSDYFPLLLIILAVHASIDGNINLKYLNNVLYFIIILKYLYLTWVFQLSATLYFQSTTFLR